MEDVDDRALSPAVWRATLRTLTSAAAGPHGFTLSVWSSGAIAVRSLGPPRLGEIVLFATGGATAFWLVHLAGRRADASASSSIVLTRLPNLAGFQLPAVLAAVGTAWVIAGSDFGAATWLAVGAGATAIYWLVAALTVATSVLRVSRRR